jgi:hypothetical protein
LIRIDARYEFAERGEPRLSTAVDAFIDRVQAAAAR